MNTVQRADSFKSRFQGTYRLCVGEFQKRQPNLYSDTRQNRLALRSNISHENQGFDLRSIMI